MKQLKRIIALIFIFSLHIEALAQHKIIYLISSPRSLSVAFLRMMQAREDFQIFHEPFQGACFSVIDPKIMHNDYRENTPKTAYEVKKMLEDAALKAPVFVKEVCGAAQHFLKADESFIKNPSVYFVFLVRNPGNVINSFYSVAQRVPRFPGSKVMYQLMQYMQDKACNKPYVIFSEELINDSENVIQAFCQHCDIPFLPHSLKWQELGKEFDGVQEWHENKKQSVTHQWHAHAIASSGFAQPQAYELDAQGHPTFAQITNPDHKKICFESYYADLPYYNLLQAYKNK